MEVRFKKNRHLVLPVLSEGGGKVRKKTLQTLSSALSPKASVIVEAARAGLSPVLFSFAMPG